MDNREDPIVSIITYKNNRFICYAKKVFIHFTDSMYAYLICLSLFFINRLHKKLYFFQFVKESDICTSQIVIANCTICKYETA